MDPSRNTTTKLELNFPCKQEKIFETVLFNFNFCSYLFNLLQYCTVYRHVKGYCLLKNVELNMISQNRLPSTLKKTIELFLVCIVFYNCYVVYLFLSNFSGFFLEEISVLQEWYH